MHTSKETGHAAQRYGALFGLIFPTVVALGVLIMIAPAVRAAIDPVEQQRQALDLEQQRAAVARAQALADQLAPVDRMIGVFWRVLPVIIVVVLLVLAIDYYRQRRRPLVRVDDAGRLPVERDLIRHAPGAALVTIRNAQQIQMAAAQRPILPSSVHYAPHTTGSTAPNVPALITEQPTAAPLILPTSAALDEYTDQIKPNHLALGVLPGGELLQVHFLRAYHALASGDTRSGKSSQLDALLVQLHQMAARGAQRGARLRLYGADAKGEMRAAWGRSALFASPIATSTNEMIDLVQGLMYGPDGIAARARQIEQFNQEHQRAVKNWAEFTNAAGLPPDLVVMFFDEMTAALELATRDRRLERALTPALQMGAGMGVYLLGGAQYMQADVLGRAASKQFTTRALFGSVDSTHVRMMFGSVERDRLDGLRPYFDGQPGRALVRCVGMTGISVMQGLYANEQNILTAIQGVEPLRDTTITTATSDRDDTATARAFDVSDALQLASTPSATALLADAGMMQIGVGDSASAGGGAVTTEERLQILSAALELSSGGKKAARREVCRRVFDGQDGGASYQKVKIVLDGAGL